MESREKMFGIASAGEFTVYALEVFRHQYSQNTVYREFVDARKIHVSDIARVEDIPFLPIEFFKTHKVRYSAKQCYLDFRDRLCPVNTYTVTTSPAQIIYSGYIWCI